MDLNSDVPLLIALLVTFVLVAILGAAEAALLRVPQVRAASLADSGSAAGQRLAEILRRLTRVLNAILLSALLLQITAATITGVLAERWFGSVGVTIASVILTLLLFVYAEAIPKTYAVRHPTGVALWLSLPIKWLERLLRPVVNVLVAFADLQMPGKGITVSPTVTEDELKRLADRAAREGEISEGDMQLIQRAFRFGDRQVDDIMVPRTEIVAVASETPVSEALDVALEAGHRRIPVYEGSIEHIVGMVGLRHLVKIPAGRRHIDCGSVKTRILGVPESKRITELLYDMQAEGIHMAVAVDEFGGTAGIVTIEDIAEELLGSMTDDGDGPPIAEAGRGAWTIDAALPIEDLSELVGADLEGDAWNTAAGYVMARLGRIPELGDEVSFEGGSIRVSGLRGRRILRLHVTKEMSGKGR